MTAVATPAPTPTRAAVHSFVLEMTPAHPVDARRHFATKLAVETDPSDVRADLQRGSAPRVVVIDARSPQQFAECHVPGAISLPHRAISAETTAHFSRDTVFVTYCWGPACNAATRAALRLSELGFQVKEMIGGIEYWRREGFPVEGTLGDLAPLVG